MPCLNPIFIKNPTTDQNKIDLPTYAPALLVPCGKCVECRKRRATDWRTRLIHETTLGQHKNALFVTLTIGPQYYDEFKRQPQVLIRRFLERVRKATKKSLRHWFVTELGDTTGRLHFHGIIYDFFPKFVRTSLKAANALLRKFWKYGNTWVDFATESTCSYIVKYMLKGQIDPATDLNFKPIVLTSAGMGKCYCLSEKSYKFHHQNADGVWYILSSNGYKIALPRYYKLKLFTEEEIFQHTLDCIIDPPSRFFRGKAYTNDEQYYQAIKTYYFDSVRRGTSVYPTVTHSVEPGKFSRINNPNCFWSLYESNGYYPTVKYSLNN